MSVVEIITKFHVNRFSVVGAVHSSFFISLFTFVWFSVCLDSEFQSNGWYKKFQDFNLHFVGHITNHSDFFSLTCSLGRCLSIISIFIYIKKGNMRVCNQIDQKFGIYVFEKFVQVKNRDDQWNKNQKKKRKQKQSNTKIITKECKSVQCAFYSAVQFFGQLWINQSNDRWLIHRKLIMKWMTTFTCFHHCRRRNRLVLLAVCVNQSHWTQVCKTVKHMLWWRLLRHKGIVRMLKPIDNFNYPTKKIQTDHNVCFCSFLSFKKK